ncbi:MAG: hypothetical protein IT341_05630 [Chloroflexi bacterium]|nr:hypothetical protein [Chloroflexota bacterium]
MHPLLRNAVIGAVGLIIAAALAVLGLIGQNPDLSVLALFVAGLLATVVAVFLYAQGWIWGSRSARRHRVGNSVLIAISGGLMAIVGAVAFGLLVILVRLFYLA